MNPYRPTSVFGLILSPSPVRTYTNSETGSSCYYVTTRDLGSRKSSGSIEVVFIGPPIKRVVRPSRPR